MNQLKPLLQLFERHPELAYLTSIILLLSLSAFIYLILDYLKRRNEKEVDDQPIRVNDTAPAPAKPVKPAAQSKTILPTIPSIEDLRQNLVVSTYGVPIQKQSATCIHYLPHEDFRQPEPWSYPYVQMPAVGAVIQLPEQHVRHMRGFSEEDFQLKLEQVFRRCAISGFHCLPASETNPPYETDITIIIREQVNLFIDIEIDEPYTATRRVPMHCIGEDTVRDAQMTGQGWMVIRFTEKQVATQAGRCLAFIARTISSVYPSFSIPPYLGNLSDPDSEPQWTAAQAEKWHKEHYRETYLGIPAFAG